MATTIHIHCMMGPTLGGGGGEAGERTKMQEMWRISGTSTGCAVPECYCGMTYYTCTRCYEYVPAVLPKGAYNSSSTRGWCTRDTVTRTVCIYVRDSSNAKYGTGVAYKPLIFTTPRDVRGTHRGGARECGVCWHGLDLPLNLS